MWLSSKNNVSVTLIYMNRVTRFAGSSYYNLRDIRVHTDTESKQANKAALTVDSDLAGIYLMESDKLNKISSSFYIF